MNPPRLPWPLAPSRLGVRIAFASSECTRAWFPGPGVVWRPYSRVATAATFSNAARFCSVNKPHLKTQQPRAVALAATESDDPRRALAAFAALENLEPYEPNWPRRAADCHRTLGESEQRLEALGR